MITAELASRFVEVAKVPWKATPHRGVQVKPLLIERETGLMTLLVKMEAGARLPDHEHVLIEQTYMIEGRLVDKEGPETGLEVGPGDFVWRPAGSRHAAWAPEGALMIAMFQAPNKFFEQNGRVVDMFGQDWNLAWKRSVPA